MSNGPTIKMKHRLNFVVLTAIILAFLFVTANIVQITVFQYDFYKKRASQQQLKPETIPANRGSIYDRNMGVIAQSATVWDVVIAPLDMKDEQKALIAKSLGEVLGDTDEDKANIEASVLKKSEKKNRYEIIKRKVEKDVADEIRTLITKDKKNVWKGVDLVENTKRYYPNSTFASSLIGFTGTDSQGLYGVEFQYDEELRGTPGYIVSAKNGIGENMPASYEEKFDPINGNNLVLTVDETIQHFLEKTLEQVMSQHKPKMGCAGIVMNVNTGEILAMANLPNFDLNNPRVVYDPETAARIAEIVNEEERQKAESEALQAQWSNKSISYAYQPGSTFKTVVASAALEEKTSSLDSKFYCPGYIQVEDRRMSCHKKEGHGQENYVDALVNSCNPAFVKIGADLGASLFYKYFRAYGLTEKTGIDLPGEGVSQYYTDKGLGTVSLASCSFGQSMALTPIQVITSTAAVVNGGYLVTPHVVKDVLDQNNNIIRSVPTTVKRQVISEETSATLRMMMESVVDVKTGSNAKILGYRIGGKSGTSQKQNPGDSEDARIGSYVAVAPADNPEIAVLIMVDEPTSNEVYGSVIAAPAAAAVLSDTLPYLGYSPQYTEQEMTKMDVTVPHLLKLGVLEATSKLSTIGLGKPKVIGEGNTVVKQVPSTGSKIPKDGTVIIYTESVEETMVEMPNVTGMSPALAKSKLEAAKFNVVINGLATDHVKSKITEQSVTQGVMTPIGTVVEITCIKSDTD